MFTPVMLAARPVPKLLRVNSHATTKASFKLRDPELSLSDF